MCVYCCVVECINTTINCLYVLWLCDGCLGVRSSGNFWVTTTEQKIFAAFRLSVVLHIYQSAILSESQVRLRISWNLKVPKSLLYTSKTQARKRNDPQWLLWASLVFFFHSSIPTGKGIRFICMRKELTLSFVESILLCRIELASSLILLILLHHTYSYSIQ